jgi:galactokinase
MKTKEQVIESLMSVPGVKRQDITVVRTSVRMPMHDDHTDHQLFPVNGLSIAAPGFVWAAYAPNSGQDQNKVIIESIDTEYPGTLSFSLDKIPTKEDLKKTDVNWARYMPGAVWALVNDPTYGGKVKRGITARIGSNVFTSAGLSSSSSTGVNYNLGLLIANNLLDQVSDSEKIRLNKVLENIFLGLNNGILDQGLIVLGKEGKLVYIDCEAYAQRKDDFFRLVDAGQNMPDFKIYFLYSGKQRDLTETNFYNARVALCAETTKRLCELSGKEYVKEAGLKQVPFEVFLKYASRLTKDQRNVALHVYGAGLRIDEGTRRWEEGDLAGDLITAGGFSLDKLFGVGSPELRYLRDQGSKVKGVAGLRQKGAGIGGGAGAYVPKGPDAESAVRDLDEVMQRYKRKFTQYADTAKMVVCTPADGIKIFRNV